MLFVYEKFVFVYTNLNILFVNTKYLSRFSFN